jgi:SIR2-like domain
MPRALREANARLSAGRGLATVIIGRDVLTTAQWTSLANSIRDGTCTPFLGAGAAAHRLPTGSMLALELADKFHYPLADKEDLTHVAQFVAVDGGDDLLAKTEILERIHACGHPVFADSEPHHVLASFKLPVYLTTNYDDFMAKAIEAAGRRCRREYCRWTRSLADDPRNRSLWQKDPEYEPSRDAPLVYHLHGCDMLPASLVVTEDDYLQFMYNISKSESITKTADRPWEMFPTAVRSALPNNCLIFLGYRLLDWDFRIIFRWLVLELQGRQKRTKIAVQLSPGPDLDAARRAQNYLNKYFKDLFEVTVFWGTAQEFLSELQDHVAGGGASPSGSRPATPPGP